MSTTFLQEQSHKAAIVAASADHQVALATAKAAYSGLAAGWAAYDVAVKAADAAKMRAIIASATLNSLGSGPSQSLFWLTGSWI